MNSAFKKIFLSPVREYILIFLLVAVFSMSIPFPQTLILLWITLYLGSLPTLWGAIKSTKEWRISIDTFNIFAIAVCFLYHEIYSATFIILMLAFARLLESYVRARTSRTLEELLKLKPHTALREKNGEIEEINSDAVLEGDILVIKDGSRIPVDGLVVFGEALINESSVTGESVPVEKVIGDKVLSSTLNESGLMKMRATKVGKDSTIERMAELIKEASKNKSRSERLADKFAGIYFPILLLLGIGTYLFSKNIEMVAALFLVACADDMAVAIPLAVTAAIGKAAKRGVIIKGGERIEQLSKIKSLVIDKTGTLTYGTFVINNVEIEPGNPEYDFWFAVGVAEKFSEHYIGRTIFKEALKHIEKIPDPQEFKVYKGSGVKAIYNGDSIAVGDYSIINDAGIKLTEAENSKIKKKIEQKDTTNAVILKNNKVMGFISLGDLPKPEAGQSIVDLRGLGVKDIRMFTGDNKLVATNIAKAIGVDNVQSSMTPDEKLHELEKIISGENLVAMVGDGVNDAAALTRADIGIAMGKEGSAVAVEVADVVILNDDLSRLPEMIVYSRKVMSVIDWDMGIWLVSNLLGFGLVFSGFAGPAMAAFYNFVSDFFPLINSSRLFKD
jgi:Cd2+/Zn2+-exporting ATPase